MRNKKGITLIELIIVLAVIAIISAILVPNFLNTTDKARLKTDIQSARILQNALELYNAEQATPISSSTDMTTVISQLDAKGYITQAQVVKQTNQAAWKLGTDGIIRIDISGCTENAANVKDKVYNQLTEQEKYYVVGGINASGLSVTGETNDNE